VATEGIEYTLQVVKFFFDKLLTEHLLYLEAPVSLTAPGLSFFRHLLSED